MALTQHKLSDKLVNQGLMYDTLRRLRGELLEKQLQLALPSLNDIYKVSTSYLCFLNNTTIRGILHIPLMRIGTTVRLHRYIPAPVLMHDNHAIIPQPSKHFLAIADDGSLYKELSQEELSYCHHIGDLYGCDDSGFSLRERKESCLLALFERDATAISDTCNFIADVETDQIMQLGPNEILLYQSHVHQSGTVYVSCPERSDTVDYVGMKRIVVPAGCYMKSRSFYFDGASSLVTSPISIHIPDFPVKLVFEPHFNDSVWITTMMRSLNRVGRTDGLKIRDIKAMYNTEHQLFTLDIVRWSVLVLVVGGLSVILCLRWRHFMKKGREFRERNFAFIYKRRGAAQSAPPSEELDDERVTLQTEPRVYPDLRK